MEILRETVSSRSRIQDPNACGPLVSSFTVGTELLTGNLVLMPLPVSQISVFLALCPHLHRSAYQITLPTVIYQLRSWRRAMC